MSDNDWYGYLSTNKTSFYIKKDKKINIINFDYRIKIFLKKEDLKNKIKYVEFQGNKIIINNDRILIDKEISFINKSFKTIIEIPVNIKEDLNNDVYIYFKDGSSEKINFKLSGKKNNIETIKLSFINDNYINNLLKIESNNIFYVEKNILYNNKIRKEVCKYNDIELMVDLEEDVINVCIYNDIEEKVFIIK